MQLVKSTVHAIEKVKPSKFEIVNSVFKLIKCSFTPLVFHRLQLCLL